LQIAHPALNTSTLRLMASHATARLIILAWQNSFVLATQPMKMTVRLTRATVTAIAAWSYRRVRAARSVSILAAAFREVLPPIPESREDLNPIAVSLLRERLLRLECACVESCCDGGVIGAVSNKGI
jgi:hypothetical protein